MIVLELKSPVDGRNVVGFIKRSASPGMKPLSFSDDKQHFFVSVCE
jgi:hypothetical protein